MRLISSQLSPEIPLAKSCVACSESKKNRKGAYRLAEPRSLTGRFLGEDEGANLRARFAMGYRRPRGSRRGKPHKRELKHTICDVAPGDRKGREGASPSSTHLSRCNAQMCR